MYRAEGNAMLIYYISLFTDMLTEIEHYNTHTCFITMSQNIHSQDAQRSRQEYNIVLNRTLDWILLTINVGLSHENSLRLSSTIMSQNNMSFPSAAQHNAV